MSHANGRRVSAGAALGVLLAVAAVGGYRPPSSAQPAGIFSSSQAATGAETYAEKCAQCHGAQLEGGAGPPLSGPNLKTLSRATKLTVSDLYQYMSTNMPLNAPGSLKPVQYATILAYILKFNGYPAGSRPLTPSAAGSSKMRVTSLKNS